MSIAPWLRTPRIRRGIAASTVILAAGGLILYRSPAGAKPNLVLPPAHDVALPIGANTTTFSGPGMHGTVSLSHTKVLVGNGASMFAEVRMVADASENALERAPLSLAIVLDTSGSMQGEKIDQAKNAAIRLIRDMRDGDEVAFVRYSDEAQIVQGLTRVGSVREDLIESIRALQAGGGTAIPRGLAAGLSELAKSSAGRVRRVILASDGLDSTRQEAESLAQSSFQRGITISSMGIGVDFDESYMGGVARAGHGNFAFVKDASALATFLRRELVETASTTVENAEVRLALPTGVRFVRASGADAVASADGTSIDLKIGSLFAGDDRRVVVELQTTLGLGEVRAIEGKVAWNRVGGANAEVPFSKLQIVATNDASIVESGRDGRVLATATSVSASTKQLEAAEAYQRGDSSRAAALVDESLKDLNFAMAAAPATEKGQLARQVQAYAPRKEAFAAPHSSEGNVVAKKAFELDSSNIGRESFK